MSFRKQQTLATAAVATTASNAWWPSQSGNNNKLDSYDHLPSAARPAKFSFTAQGMQHQRSAETYFNTPPSMWRDLESQASAAYARPFSDLDLPVSMRSEPLQKILHDLPKVERFEIDLGRICHRVFHDCM